MSAVRRGNGAMTFAARRPVLLATHGEARSQVIREGIVHAPGHGLLALSTPGFGEYIARRHPDEA